MGVNGQLYALATLPMGKEPLVLIEYEAGWASQLVWIFWRSERNPFLCRELNPSIFSPYPSHYTDYSQNMRWEKSYTSKPRNCVIKTLYLLCQWTQEQTLKEVTTVQNELQPQLLPLDTCDIQWVGHVVPAKCSALLPYMCSGLSVHFSKNNYEINVTALVCVCWWIVCCFISEL